MDEIEGRRRAKEAREEGGQGGKGGARAGIIEERTWRTVYSLVQQMQWGTGARGLPGHTGAGGSDGQAEVSLILEPDRESTERTQKFAGLDVSRQAQWFSWYPERTKC
jgi:hypothetical protein